METPAQLTIGLASIWCVANSDPMTNVRVALGASATFEPSTRVPAKIRAPHEHAEALLNVYVILQELQDRGVLDLAKGALGSGEEVLQILVNVANTPEMVRGIRNMMILAKVANSFEPELLESLEQAVQESLAEARKPKPVGLWQLMKKLLSQESRRVLIATASILQAVGKSLGK